MALIVVGDRVRSVVDHPDGNQYISAGSTGTVAVLEEHIDGMNIGVAWDSYVYGHELFGNTDTEHCVFGYGWWVGEDQISIIEDDDDEQLDPVGEDELMQCLLGVF